MSSSLPRQISWVMAVLSLVAAFSPGCSRARELLPEQLPGPLAQLFGDPPPVANAELPPSPSAPAQAKPSQAVVAPVPVAAPAASPPAAAAGPSLVDSLAAAGSVAGKLLLPHPIDSAAPPVGPGSRAARALSTLRGAGLALPDSAVVELSGRLVLYLEAADADHYEEELLAQWALGFATLAATGASQVAIVTSIDGQPMMDMQAQAADVNLLAAGTIDTGEFFRRVSVQRLGPEPAGRADLGGAAPSAELDAAVPAKAARPTPREPAARPASERAPLRPSTPPRLPARINTGRAPR